MGIRGEKGRATRAGRTLGKLDDVVGCLAQLLAPDGRRLDAAVADQLGGQAAQKRLALVRRAVELLQLVSVACPRERTGGWSRPAHALG